MWLLLFWIFCAVMCAIVASNKGRNGAGWFFLGLFFGLFALLIVAVLPNLKAEQMAQDVAERHAQALIGAQKEAEAADTKTCPQCAETVKAAAKICRFCQYEFPPEVQVIENIDPAEEPEPRS